MNIPRRKLAAALTAKGQVELVLAEISKQHLAKLNAHWYEAVLVSLAYDPKNKIVQIHIRANKAKQLLYPQAGPAQSG